MREPRNDIEIDPDDHSAINVAVVKKNGIEVHRAGAKTEDEAVRAARKWIDADAGLKE